MNMEELDHQIEKSLRMEPVYQLPADFAGKVVARVIRRTQWKNDLLEYFYLFGLLILVGAIASGTYYLVNKDSLFRIYRFIAEHSLQLALLALLLNFIVFADRVLLRLLFSRWSKT